MKLSQAQITKRLKDLHDEVARLSRSTRVTVSKIKKLKVSLSTKKDQSKVEALRKKLQALS